MDRHRTSNGIDLLAMSIENYDFRRCKLCGEMAAAPRYHLKNTDLMVCANCDFHMIAHLDTLPTAASAQERRARVRPGRELEP